MIEGAKKVLFVASIDKHILRFHIPSLQWFYERGYEVHVACNGNASIPYCHKIHQIHFVRSPFSFGNVRALFQLSDVIKSENFSLIHCHTAVASILTRIAAQSSRKKYGLKVLYTAHGFHFFKGAPFYYWLLFYPIERFFSRFLDCQITINTEDYQLALDKFYCKRIRRIPGMGRDSSRFSRLNRDGKEKLRLELNIPENSKVIVYVAEFIHRKNHAFLINVVARLKEQVPELVLLLPGRGRLFEEMKDLAKRNKVDHFVHFLGFREDIDKVLACSDFVVSSSRQEGLAMSLVEAMMSGLPAVATDERGNREIINHGENGFLFPQEDENAFLKFSTLLVKDQDLYAEMSENAYQSSFRFDLKHSMKALNDIYEEVINS